MDEAPLSCSWNRPAHARLMLNEPLRCTAITSDQSDQLILWKITSRRMPALLAKDIERGRRRRQCQRQSSRILRLSDGKRQNARSPRRPRP